MCLWLLVQASQMRSVLNFFVSHLQRDKWPWTRSHDYIALQVAPVNCPVRRLFGPIIFTVNLFQIGERMYFIFNFWILEVLTSRRRKRPFLKHLLWINCKHNYSSTIYSAQYTIVQYPIFTYYSKLVMFYFCHSLRLSDTIRILPTLVKSKVYYKLEI